MDRKRGTSMSSYLSTVEWAALEVFDCSTCGQPMPFEAVDCADGHGEDCPDRVCVSCGLVLVAGPVPLAARRSA
jgi:heterodisulfide reductase subunit A-like polyferredoxin